jgi:hypothetical protein
VFKTSVLEKIILTFRTRAIDSVSLNMTVMVPFLVLFALIVVHF